MFKVLSRSFAVGVLILSTALPAAAADLEVETGQRVGRVKSRRHQDRTYYRLSDIARVLGLRLSSEGQKMTVEGPRGRLELVEQRPLIRYKDQYILMESPVWARSRQDWYVSEDFMTKAAPLLLDNKLEKAGARRYRLGLLSQNEVSVEVVNYPDHVSIIFLPSRRSGLRVVDLQSLIKVEFDEYLVKPRMSATQPDPRIVSSIRFDSGDLFGSFEIKKGPLFSSFREYDLKDPLRKVVGLYGPPVPTSAPTPGAALRPAPDIPPPPLLESAPEFSPHRLYNVIAIDPGHGGENYGVHPSQDSLEKTFALSLAEKLNERIKKTRRFNPVLTRTRDLNLSTELRSSVGNRHKIRAYVSIHLGGSSSDQVGGPVVYVHRYMDDPPASSRLVPWEEGQRRHLEKSRELAEKVQAQLNRLFGEENQVSEAPLAVLAPVTAPAILIEAGFLTNPEDRARVADPEFQERIADSIATALEEFLK